MRAPQLDQFEFYSTYWNSIRKYQIVQIFPKDLDNLKNFGQLREEIKRKEVNKREKREESEEKNGKEEERKKLGSAYLNYI